jgi:hypothetical protein
VSLAYGRLRAKIITIVQKKDAAYARLVGKLKDVEPSASSRSESGTEDIYQPKLWYFTPIFRDQLQFT